LLSVISKLLVFAGLFSVL